MGCRPTTSRPHSHTAISPPSSTRATTCQPPGTLNPCEGSCKLRLSARRVLRALHPTNLEHLEHLQLRLSARRVRRALHPTNLE